MDKKTNKILKDYISFIASKNMKLVKVFLFGSYAKRSATADSDIDIAFIIKDLKDDEKFDIQVQLMLFASKFDMRIEPHPISNSDFNSNNPFVAEIKKTGVELLYDIKSAWCLVKKTTRLTQNKIRNLGKIKKINRRKKNRTGTKSQAMNIYYYWRK